MEYILENFFNLEIMQAALPMVLKGFGMTLVLIALVVPVGCLGGLAVALLGTSRSRLVRWATIVYVDFFRAFPPLVLLIFIYAGLPFAGIDLPAIVSVAIAFLLNTSAYYGEIFRAGIESVGDGQTEAARSTGLTGAQTMGFVVIPQAVRNVLPDLVSNTLEVAKLTSLASVVALPEMLYAADMARSVTFNASPIVLAALFYLLLLWPVVRLLSVLEHKTAAR
ncbi:MAG TPA: amino acid ABC transporter permease [Alphaproteobacteria bacterium]|nr:amino acid ABC transporter permease [Alphaproteobacteria bacterium]